MGLFDKKYCDICGEKIGLLGNRKLSDGNLCKDCAAKLSPWFMDQVADCQMDIRHTRTELKRENAQGEKVSYDPPVYEYDYTFWMEISVIGHPYIGSIRFRLNDRDITIRSEARRSLLGMPTDDIHPEFNVEYREYLEMATLIVAVMKLGSAPQAAEADMAAPAPVSAPAPAPTPVSSGAWTCRSCGVENTGKFCQSCGSPRPAAVLRCSRCGWQPQNGAAAMNVLRGPRPMTPYDSQFLRDRLRGKEYLPLAYFAGAAPENNYAPAVPYVLNVQPDPRPQDIEPGYIRVFISTPGADSPRPIKLRQKPSTGQWFLWEYSSSLSGIRMPVAQDPWA